MLRMCDVAKRLGLSLPTVYALSMRGELPPPVKVIGTTKFFTAFDIDFFRKTRVLGKPGRKRRMRSHAV